MIISLGTNLFISGSVVCSSVIGLHSNWINVCYRHVQKEHTPYFVQHVAELKVKAYINAKLIFIYLYITFYISKIYWIEFSSNQNTVNLYNGPWNCTFFTLPANYRRISAFHFSPKFSTVIFYASIANFPKFFFLQYKIEIE